MRYEKVTDYIYVCKKIIPKDTCDYIINDIETREWRKHSWYNVVNKTFGSEETKELDVQSATPELQNLLTPFIISAGAEYNSRFAYQCERTQQIMNKFSSVRFNRYSPGQIMRTHVDHIHSIFSPPEQGIPVLSFIINLNEGYEGGELVFGDDYIVPLGAGDIIMFPSNFIFPHRVDEIVKGCRWSAVSWGW